MNFESIPHLGQPAVPVQPNWRRQVGEWRELLAQCANKPTRKRVHALRSLTLRLRAAIEFRLVEQPSGSAAVRAFKRWDHEGKKLRRTLEPVRNADVFLARLGGLRHTLGASTAGEPRLSARCEREIDRIENRLKQRRQRKIDALKAKLEARGKRLCRLCEQMEAGLESEIPDVEVSAAQAALRIFARLVGEFPGIESSNMHSFRKRLKQALYLAESSAAFDPGAKRLAAAFKKMHLATGEWHDWHELALQARRILSGCAKRDGVVPLLEKLTERALKRATGICRRAAAQILNNESESQVCHTRKPVASAPGGSASREPVSLQIAS
jgi:CHAD domain-containing protein